MDAIQYFIGVLYNVRALIVKGSPDALKLAITLIDTAITRYEKVED